jgi:hypothetical protein
MIIFPYQIGETFGVEMSTWSFLSGNRSMLQSKVLYIDGYRGTAELESTYSAVRAVIGMTRDAYMLSEYRMPICFPEIAKNDSVMLPETRKALVAHYENLCELVSTSDDYKLLCSQSEIEKINRSLDTIKLIAE